MSLDYSFIFDESKDNSQKSTQKDFGVWGLNQNATVVEFKVWPQGFKGTGACVRYAVKISNNQYSGIIYVESKVYRGGNEVKPGDKSYEEAKQQDILEKMKTLVHIAKAIGLPREILENSLNTRKPSTFMEFATLLTNLCQGYLEKSRVDVFLEYEPKPKGSTQYKQIPDSSFSGAFMVPATQGEWIRAMKNGKLMYTRDGNPEETHPFWRSAKYMCGPRAVKRDKDNAQRMGTSEQQEMKTDISQFGEDLPW